VIRVGLDYLDLRETRQMAFVARQDRWVPRERRVFSDPVDGRVCLVCQDKKVNVPVNPFLIIICISVCSDVGCS